MVGSRGFEPRSARSERAASANCATSRCEHGPSGWTRTTTTRVKSPVCCVDTTEGIGANGGIRTRTSRLGRPAGDRYPTLALVRPTGIEPVPPRWQRGMLPAHPGRTWTGVAGPCDILQLSKTPLFRAWWAARDSNPIAPGEYGFTARQRTIRSYRPYWRQRQDSNLDPRVLETRMLIRYTTLP